MYSVYIYTERSLTRIGENLTRRERQELINRLAIRRKSNGKGIGNEGIITYCGGLFHSSF